MPRLPIPGSDDGSWGDILNEYLSVELNSDGSLKKAGDIIAAQDDATQALSDAADAQADAAQASTELTTHTADTTSVHGIADTADLIVEGDSRLTDSRTPTGAAGGVLSGTYPNPTFAADLATQAELDAHVAAGDPHSVYQKESEKNAADGYAGLDSSTLVPRALLGTGTLDGTKFLRDDGTWQNVTASLTPWTSDIDADNHNLLDLGGLAVGGGTLTSGYSVELKRSIAGLSTSRRGLDISESLTYSTPTGQSYRGLSVTPAVTLGSGTLSALYGVYVAPSIGSGFTGVTTYYGGYFAPTAGLLNANTFVGVGARPSPSGGSVLGKGIEAVLDTSAGGGFTTGVGVDVSSTTDGGAGTISTMIGLRITSLDGTTKWGMQVGNYNSYHEGAVRVGALTGGSTATPNSRLEVVEPALGSDVARFTTYAAGAGANPIERVVQNRALTLSATQATLMSITIPASTTVSVHAYVAARRDNSSSGGTIEDGAFYEIVGTFKNVAGTATQIGTTTALVTHESQVLWDCSFDVSGATARVRITGAANNSIYWQGTCHIFQSGSA